MQPKPFPRIHRPVTWPLRPLARKVGFVPMHQQPGNSRFQNADEHRYFNIFTAKTAYHLGGFYDPVLWNRIVLQASELELSIRHAVIAIGALDMTSFRAAATRTCLGVGNHALNMSEGMPNISAAEHHLFALRQYSKAVKEMRENIFGERYNSRTALLASILIICFETYHGYHESAARQVRTSIRLLEELKTKDAHGVPSDPIEDELVCAFDRLDIQAMSHTDQLSLDEHIRLKDSGAGLTNNMPTEFATINEARRYLNVIVRRVVHFGCIVWRLGQENQASQKPSLSHFDHGAAFTREDVLAQHKGYILESELWMSAFLPLFRNSQAAADTKESLASISLRMHFLAMYVSLVHLIDVEEVSYDRSRDVFIEIVTLAKTLLQYTGSIFTFDLQTVWPLDIVAKKCRESFVRREAIRLLACKPRREGIWDSLLAAKISLWVVEIEEEGQVNGFIPEESRVRQIGTKLDLEKHRAEVWCAQPQRDGPKGEMIRREIILSW